MNIQVPETWSLILYLIPAAFAGADTVACARLFASAIDSEDLANKWKSVRWGSYATVGAVLSLMAVVLLLGQGWWSVAAAIGIGSVTWAALYVQRRGFMRAHDERIKRGWQGNGRA